MVVFQRPGDDLKELEILFAAQSYAPKSFIRITVENYQVRNAFTPWKRIVSRSGFEAVSTLGGLSRDWEIRNYITSGNAKRA